jgi:2-polyprenyl-3-methyl-5-hydroxy-6-metoxy-1,4-benzoquinol methylase
MSLGMPLMGLRTELCYALSARRIQPPSARTATSTAYADWRAGSLAQSWSAFADEHVAGKDVLDFGCGDGELSIYLAQNKHPRRLVGVDLNATAIGRARAHLATSRLAHDSDVAFEVGDVNTLPVADAAFDTVVAFDCLEHVMSPAAILRDWHRALKPGGHCLIEWFPYKGPWGPHMEALVPIPWAHVLFGEHAMLRTAERIYDHPRFQPRHWDLDDNGRKRPNKWRQWSSFDEQGYINKLDIPGFRRLAADAGFDVGRLERRSFRGGALRRQLGTALMAIPVIGEHFVSYVLVELKKPAV